ASKKDTWGQGGPGYSFPDEIRQSLKFDAPGDLAMANSGANTNGSQFFITFAPADFLSGKYNLFGKLVSGQD
uniref:peptidylprolyl isomerase n=1 Tax=Klebsiella pneumoniae TaxID=573 RepID=UPI00190F11B7